MARWQELIEKWAGEEMLDVDTIPNCFVEDPDQLVDESDPFDPAGESPIDLFGVWWE